MKKLLLVLAVAGLFAACNSKKSEKTEEKMGTDTTIKVSHDTTVTSTDTTHM